MHSSYNLLRNIKVKTKLGLVVLCMGIPIISLVYFLFSFQQNAINITKTELSGINLYSNTMTVRADVLKVKYLAKLYNSGDIPKKNEISSSHDKIDKGMKKLQNLDLSENYFHNLKSRISNLSIVWNEEKNAWRASDSNIKAENYANIESEVNALLHDIVQETRLKLDTEPSTSMLINVMIDSIPLATELINELQAIGVDISSRGIAAFEERADISNTIARLSTELQSLKDTISMLEEYDSESYSDFQNVIVEIVSASDAFLSIVPGSSAEGGSFEFQTAKFFEVGALSLDKIDRLRVLVHKRLESMLNNRIASSVFDRNVQLLIATILTAVAVLVSVITYRYITIQISSITNVFRQIDKGNFQARAQIFSVDELGSMAYSLNEMLDRTLSLIQSQDERDSIQESIMKLLDEVSDVAKGDLTVEAEVTEDITGAIADSFNHMIYQLRNIVNNVQKATLEVGSSASLIQATAEQLADGSSTQADQIIDSTAALDEMAVSIQQVSENASLSSTVAEQALDNAKQGANAVQNTIQGMQRIRSQVQETAKRIKRLGERSQEISEIVQLIGDIADRTSILALNASIQAARAGEAGRSFAVVAEEVERLAERSTNATKQIASLVNTIQSETNEAVIAMEESTHEVVQGSQVADKAGQALTEIENVSSRLAGLIQSITLAATQQARGSDNLSKAMNEISQVTQHTASGTKKTANDINQLALLAQDLRDSVSTFKTPAVHNHNDVNMIA